MTTLDSRIVSPMLALCAAVIVSVAAVAQTAQPAPAKSVAPPPLMVTPSGAGSMAPNPSGTAAMGDKSGARLTANKPVPAQGLSRQDRDFMIKAAESGHAEVTAGKIAATNVGNADLKKFAERMVQDHGKAGDELKQIAQGKSVLLPAEPDRSHRRMAKQLQGLSGDKFDRVYVRESGVKDHRSAVALFTREAQKGSDAEVKAFAQKTLPVIEEHLKHAQSMHDAIVLMK